MSQLKLMRSKLHRVKVSSTNLNYVGSITIDKDLLDKIGIVPLEEVEIVNVTNGNRWTTYVLPGDAGKGEICPNGGGAYLCKAGDLLIIYAYAYVATDVLAKNGHRAYVLISDEHNRCGKLLIQELGNEANNSYFKTINVKQ